MQTGSATFVSRASAGGPNFVFDPRRIATAASFDYGWIRPVRRAHPGDLAHRPADGKRGTDPVRPADRQLERSRRVRDRPRYQATPLPAWPGWSPVSPDVTIVSGLWVFPDLRSKEGADVASP